MINQDRKINLSFYSAILLWGVCIATFLFNLSVMLGSAAVMYMAIITLGVGLLLTIFFYKDNRQKKSTKKRKFPKFKLPKFKVELTGKQKKEEPIIAESKVVDLEEERIKKIDEELE